jgi:hypothetical protein
MKITVKISAKNANDIEAAFDDITPKGWTILNTERVGWWFNRRWESTIYKYIGPRVVVKPTDKPVEEV